MTIHRIPTCLGLIVLALFANACRRGDRLSLTRRARDVHPISARFASGEFCEDLGVVDATLPPEAARTRRNRSNAARNASAAIGGTHVISPPSVDGAEATPVTAYRCHQGELLRHQAEDADAERRAREQPSFRARRAPHDAAVVAGPVLMAVGGAAVVGGIYMTIHGALSNCHSGWLGPSCSGDAELVRAGLGVMLAGIVPLIVGVVTLVVGVHGRRAHEREFQEQMPWLIDVGATADGRGLSLRLGGSF